MPPTGFPPLTTTRIVTGPAASVVVAVVVVAAVVIVAATVVVASVVALLLLLPPQPARASAPAASANAIRYRIGTSFTTWIAESLDCAQRGGERPRRQGVSEEDAGATTAEGIAPGTG